MQAIAYFDGNFSNGTMTGGWVCMIDTAPVTIASDILKPKSHKISNPVISEWRALDLNSLSDGVARGKEFTWSDNPKSESSFRHKAVSFIAHALWDKNGRPEGKDLEIWLAAEDLYISAR